MPHITMDTRMDTTAINMKVNMKVITMKVPLVPLVVITVKMPLVSLVVITMKVPLVPLVPLVPPVPLALSPALPLTLTQSNGMATSSNIFSESDNSSLVVNLTKMSSLR